MTNANARIAILQEKVRQADQIYCSACTDVATASMVTEDNMRKAADQLNEFRSQLAQATEHRDFVDRVREALREIAEEDRAATASAPQSQVVEEITVEPLDRPSMRLNYGRYDKPPELEQ
jgi:hypothetical protein